MIVLDASVIAKWIFEDEEGGEKAGRLRGTHIAGTEVIAVPDLLFYEVANVLTTKTRLSQEDSALALSLLWDFQLERVDFGLDEFLDGMALSRKYKITMYDAAYIELARRLNCVFVTADKKLYEKVKTLRMVKLL